MNRLKERITEFRKNTRDMSFRERADYIWTYYKLPILGTAFGLFFIAALASSVITGANTRPVLTAGILSDLQFSCSEDTAALLEEAFPDASGNTAPELRPISSVASETDLYAPIQLAAYLAAGDLDAMITDQATLDYISDSGEILQVTDISATELGQKAKELGIEPLYYIVYAGHERADAAASFGETILSHTAQP